MGRSLPGVCGASTIFFFRQYMIGLPKELLEAGRIDGAVSMVSVQKLSSDCKTGICFYGNLNVNGILE